MRIAFTLFVLSACSLDVDYTGSYFACGEGGTCPSGYTCVQEVCLPEVPPPPPCSQDVSAGGGHSCSVRTDGTVWCWGLNNFGQLGDNTTTASATPVQAEGITNAIAVSAGAEHTCAVGADGSAWCWGNSARGQVGDGSMASADSPRLLSLSGVTAIATGSEFTCAIASGTVHCWGSNTYGQLGDGSNVAKTTPANIGLAATQLSVYGDSACSLDAQGVAKCWGEGMQGQFGIGTSDNRNSPVEVARDAREIMMSEDHACYVTTSGGLRCAGIQDNGRLGNGFLPSTNMWVDVPIAAPLHGLEAGFMHSCGIDDESNVWCWGYNGEGRLGTGDDDTRPFAVRTQFTDVVEVEAGADHTCARTSSGAVLCAGFNAYGQLGNGYATAYASPFTVPGITDATSVATSSDTTCALLADKTVSCWGYGEQGTTANGDLTSPTPTRALGLSNIAAIKMGGAHACARSETGTLLCWGYNVYGQLGYGARFNSSIPQAVQLPAAVTDFAVGNEHTCALLTTGAVYCWGFGEQGQLGTGAFTYGYQESSPTTPVPMLSNVNALVAGEQHNCALLSGGGVRCWGANYYAGLGTMGMATNTPVDATITGVTALSGRGTAMFALKGTELWAWGNNCEGRLGVGSCNSDPNAQLVPGVGAVTKVRGGYTSSCAIRADKTVMCWGNNQLGAIGNGVFGTGLPLPPTAVQGVTNAIDIDVGYAHACAVIEGGSVACWGNNWGGQIGDGHTATEDVVGTRLVCE